MSDDVFPPPITDLSDRCTISTMPGYSELVIWSPRVEDSGIYMCIAENIVATDEVSLHLQVEGTATNVQKYRNHQYSLHD